MFYKMHDNAKTTKKWTEIEWDWCHERECSGQIS